MQDWLDFAQKNGLEIKETGRCQLCNSDVKNGIIECIDIASQITHKLDHEKGIKHMTIFLCVDAHALQHSEIHGRWNNHYHLTRLNLILKRKIIWNYKLSPILSEVIDSYKEKNINEIISKRGKLTVKNVDNSISDEEYIKIVWSWAEEVYKSFEESHNKVEKISDLFFKRVFA